MQKKVIRKHSQARIDEMVNAIRNEIITNLQAVGTYLPSESDLEKRFRLGNTSVRKGLEQLVREGVIRKIPRVGNIVVGQPAEEQPIVRLGVYNTTDREMELTGLLEQFQKRHPNIRVQTVMIPTNEYAGYIKQHMADGTLDAAIINHHTFRQFSSRQKTDLLEPLQPLEQTSGYYPFTTGPFADQGKLLVQPLIFSPLVVCYNPSHLKDRGLSEPVGDWTWNELMELARKAAIENERFGFCFHLLSRNRWPVFLLQSGIDFTPDREGFYRLPDKVLTECLGVCRELVEQPNVFPTMLSGLDSAAVEWFKDGKVSMIMTTYFSLNQLKHSEMDYDVAPLPYVREKGNLLSVIGAIVSRKSKSKEAAKRLVEFLGSYEAQVVIRSKTLSIPAHREAAEWDGDADVRHPAHFRIFDGMMPTYRLLEHMSLTSKQLSAIQKEFELFLTGLQDGVTMSRRMEQVLQDMNSSQSIE